MVATEIIFLMERGLNLFEINIVSLVTVIIVFTFEIPTGIIADTYGRKVSFVCSCFIIALGMFVYSIGDSLSLFVLASFIFAIGNTLESGAFKAWLVDSIDYHSYSDYFIDKEHIYVKETQAKYLASIIGAFCGVFLAEINISLPWIAAGILMTFVGVISIIYMKEEYLVDNNSSTKNIQVMKSTIKNSIKCIKSSETLKFIFAMGLLHSFGTKGLYMQWQPYFADLFQSEIILGFIWAGISIAIISGTTLSKNLSFNMKKKERIMTSQIAVGFGIFLCGVTTSIPIVIISFLFIFFMMGISIPIKEEYLNETITNTERATLISCMSIIYSIGSVIGLLFSGYIAEYYSISMTWMISGLALIFLTLLILKNHSKEKSD
ncbi:MAG: hypothetical protein KAI57_02850 [Candidatus Pacebacteria bacterium]|nr:hypothetical protein [Candidatus Paceibacterota bacterium]